MGIVCLICINFANIITQALTACVITVSTKMLNPKWNYKTVVTFWSTYCALFLATGIMWKVYGLRQEAVYILMGSATAKALGYTFHLEPGHLITLDTGVEFFWPVEDFVESVYRHNNER